MMSGVKACRGRIKLYLSPNMDNSLSYADIIENTLKEATKDQPRLQTIRLYPVCVRASVASANRPSGHFLILATGWDKQI
jgi:hypothetical protein